MNRLIAKLEPQHLLLFLVVVCALVCVLTNHPSAAETFGCAALFLVVFGTL